MHRQWQQGRGCLVGGPVRLGLEAADTGNWCEPTPPKDWQGKRLVGRSATGMCAWGEDLPYQCFGLGPEKTKGADADEHLSQAECQKQCCEAEKCDVWQWREDKGCFWGVEGHCERVMFACSRCAWKERDCACNLCVLLHIHLPYRIMIHILEAENVCHDSVVMTSLSRTRCPSSLRKKKNNGRPDIYIVINCKACVNVNERFVHHRFDVLD